MYRITIAEQLDTRWQEWFDDLTIAHAADGHTVLSGPLRDQAALHGVLRKISNLGLTLISITPESSCKSQRK